VSIPAQTPLPAIVIGRGISGLSCAYRLQQAGISVRVLDAANHPGGVISTIEKDGFLFELGPQSFLSSQPLLELIASLGLTGELLHADARAPRYVLLHGRLVQAPLAPQSLLTTPLLGARTKWRLVTEMLRHTRPPAGDESIASFVRRKFGDELLNRLVAPFVSGVYAGDPEKLSLRASFPKVHEFEATYGSVLRGAMKSRPPKGTPRPGLCSFRRGMETLPRTLGMRLGDAFLSETSVVEVRRAEASGKRLFELAVTHGGQYETLLASAVIVATPTNAASQMLKGLWDKCEEIFSRVEYAPIAVVSAGYRREQIRQSTNGFGFLVPRSEGLRVLGTVWNSSLFPGRAPEGMVCFTSFAGGATDPELCQWSDAEIKEIVRSEAGRVLRIEGDPVITSIHRYPRALPQYNLGHSEIVSALGAFTSSVPGLFLTGNYLTGPSIGSCVEQAIHIADAASAYLASIGV
jgi:oxygen-dependent protoporphyrinogen oxidase